MIASMLRSAVADYLPPDRADRLCELVGELADRLGMMDMIAIMGDFAAIQSYVQAGSLEAAKHRAIDLAERYDAHELAAFLAELAHGESPDHQ